MYTEQVIEQLLCFLNTSPMTEEEQLLKFWLRKIVILLSYFHFCYIAYTVAGDPALFSCRRFSDLSPNPPNTHPFNSLRPFLFCGSNLFPSSFFRCELSLHSRLLVAHLSFSTSESPLDLCSGHQMGILFAYSFSFKLSESPPFL